MAIALTNSCVKILRHGVEVLLAGLWAISASGYAEVPSLGADLSLQFDCGSTDIAKVEREAEYFLQQKGFDVLNQGKLQRQHGVYLEDLRIVAIDKAERLIDVIALSHAKGHYALTLNTPPPTRRAKTLESSIEDFVVRTLGCRVAQATRSANPASAKDLHHKEVLRIQNLFREGEVLEGRRRS